MKEFPPYLFETREWWQWANVRDQVHYWCNVSVHCGSADALALVKFYISLSNRKWTSNEPAVHMEYTNSELAVIYIYIYIYIYIVQFFLKAKNGFKKENLYSNKCYEKNGNIMNKKISHRNTNPILQNESLLQFAIFSMGSMCCPGF